MPVETAQGGPDDAGATGRAGPEATLGFLAGLLDALPNAVFVKDERHRWVLLNERFCLLLGRAREELLGRADDEFFPKAEAEEFRRKDDLVFSTGQVVESEERFTDVGGTSHVVLTRKTLLLDPAGRRLLVGVITDISGRKQLEEELVRSRAELERRVASRTAELSRANERLREEDLQKDEFLALLSHELRNPLAPLRNALWLLEHSSPDAELAARSRETISRQVQHLTRLVDDLLDVTRIAEGKVRLQRCRLDLAEVVRRAVQDHRPLFETAGVVLDLQEGGLPAWVDADPTRIAQVVGNLLVNAAKFSHPGGRVEVGVAREANGIAALRVRDQGVGFPPQLSEKLFEAFTRASVSLQRNRGGLGLGLALVRSLVALHGGTASAHSAGLERGAEFVVRLPLAPEHAALQPPIARVAVPRVHRRVLIIEDNADAAETLREMLLLWDHEVEVERNGRDGVSRARAFRPDLIICDVGLPELDGYGVARAVRADPTLGGVFMVAVTGYASPEDQRKAAEAGFDRHLAKPVPIDVMEELLSTFPRAAPGGSARC
jgi:PAS domain S-box-containing protein